MRSCRSKTVRNPLSRKVGIQVAHIERMRTLLAVVLVAALTVASGFARVNAATQTDTPKTAEPSTGQSQHPEDRHLDLDLVAASLEQCELASAAMTDVRAKFNSATKAETLAASRAALDSARDSLRELEHHLGSCGDTMKMLLTNPGHPPDARGPATKQIPANPARP